jgi:hypothetical protein
MMKTTFHSWFLATVLAIGASQTVHADEVTDWNQIMLAATITPPASPGPTSTRGTAIVQAAVFDAVNGIERRYTPIHVPPAAAPGASKRAAAVQAAYASLVRLYPALTATFDQQRMLSLAAIASGPAAEHSKSIERGIEWGQTVADAIWTWRSTDGFNTVLPPFMGGLNPGEWRPTPPGFVPGLFQVLAITSPWVIESPSQFRPSGPPALTSPQYTTDYDETQSKGSKTSSTRTLDETNFSLFWASTNPASLWDPVAISLAAQGHFKMSKTSRLLAHVNLALADAAIGCWEAKYVYDFWRPVTAIPLGGTDGNPDTAADPTWEPLLGTPGFPEYPSGHSCVSGAAGRILTHYFGDTPVTVGSNTMPGVTRQFPNLTAALEEVKSARVFAGIHFRTACNDGQALGIGVADYILVHSLLPVEGDHEDESEE